MTVAVARHQQGGAAMVVAMRAAGVSVKAVVVRAVVMVLVRAAVTVRAAARVVVVMAVRMRAMAVPVDRCGRREGVRGGRESAQI